MTYRFKLNFIKPGPQDPAFTPIWNIFIAHSPSDDQGNSLITPLENHEPDIDREIDQLIKELETIRKEVKRKYRR